MANSENTAVNELIARVTGVTGVPAAPQVQEPTIVGPPPLVIAPPAMHTSYPATMPVAAPFETHPAVLPTSYPVVPRALLGEVAPLLADPAPAAEPLIAVQGDPASAQSWTPPTAGQGWAGDERKVATLQLKLRKRLDVRALTDVRAVIGKLVLPVALLVVAGLAIGGYVGLDGKRADRNAPAPAVNPAPAVVESVTAPAAVVESAAAPAAAVESAAAPAAVVEPAAAPAPPVVQIPPAAAREPAPPPRAAEPARALPALVEVRIDSIPSGATVTLIDRGRSQYVGSTPVNAAVDPSREYDLVFTRGNQPPQQEHLDASSTRRVVVTLGKRAAIARPADAAPRRSDRTAPAQGGDGVASGAGGLAEGTLMISSKPPCEIVIDGRPTGLTTPQRSILLSPGTHKITLINGENAIKKTISVQITANATEKLIEDFMK